MGGRIDIEADDVFEFLGELRVVRQLERADAMRRELVGFKPMTVARVTFTTMPALMQRA